MSELKNLIDQIAGGMAVEEAIPQFKQLVLLKDPNRPAGDLSYEDKERRAMEDDNDYDNTFSEVVAAWIGGQLSDEQYQALRAAVEPSQDDGEE